MFFSEDIVRERLRDVLDPEMRLSVVDLGLIYAIDIEGDSVRITYTLTTPACPLGGLIAEQMRRAVLDIPGVREVELALTFSPPWDPSTMASEDARLELGIW
ncbi:MAG: metal-sulfur cluster assembly factor [Dehalococcoidia bacterium]